MESLSTTFYFVSFLVFKWMLDERKSRIAFDLILGFSSCIYDLSWISVYFESGLMGGEEVHVGDLSLFLTSYKSLSNWTVTFSDVLHPVNVRDIRCCVLIGHKFVDISIDCEIIPVFVIYNILYALLYGLCIFMPLIKLLHSVTSSLTL